MQVADWNANNKALGQLSVVLLGKTVPVPEEGYGTERATVQQVLSVGDTEPDNDHPDTALCTRDVKLKITYTDKDGLEKEGFVTGDLRVGVESASETIALSADAIDFQAYIDGPDET